MPPGRARSSVAGTGTTTPWTYTCPGAPLTRSEARVTIERLLDRTNDIRVSEAAHGPAGARRYDYMPTYMFTGLVALNLEFTARD